MKIPYLSILVCFCLLSFAFTTLNAQQTEEDNSMDLDLPTSITDKSNWIYWNASAPLYHHGNRIQFGYGRRINSKYAAGIEGAYIKSRGDNRQNFFHFNNYRGYSIRPFFHRTSANGFFYYGTSLDFELINFNEERLYNVNNNYILTEHLIGQRKRTALYGLVGAEIDLWGVGYLGLSFAVGAMHTNTDLQETILPDNAELLRDDNCFFFCRPPYDIRAGNTFRIAALLDMKIGFYF